MKNHRDTLREILLLVVIVLLMIIGARAFSQGVQGGAPWAPNRPGSGGSGSNSGSGETWTTITTNFAPVYTNLSVSGAGDAQYNGTYVQDHTSSTTGNAWSKSGVQFLQQFAQYQLALGDATAKYTNSTLLGSYTNTAAGTAPAALVAISAYVTNINGYVTNTVTITNGQVLVNGVVNGTPTITNAPNHVAAFSQMPGGNLTGNAHMLVASDDQLGDYGNVMVLGPQLSLDQVTGNTILGLNGSLGGIQTSNANGTAAIDGGNVIADNGYLSVTNDSHPWHTEVFPTGIRSGYTANSGGSDITTGGGGLTLAYIDGSGGISFYSEFAVCAGYVYGANGSSFNATDGGFFGVDGAGVNNVQGHAISASGVFLAANYASDVTVYAYKGFIQADVSSKTNINLDAEYGTQIFGHINDNVNLTGYLGGQVSGNVPEGTTNDVGTSLIHFGKIISRPDGNDGSSGFVGNGSEITDLVTDVGGAVPTQVVFKKDVDGTLIGVPIDSFYNYVPLPPSTIGSVTNVTFSGSTMTLKFAGGTNVLMNITSHTP